MMLKFEFPWLQIGLIFVGLSAYLAVRWLQTTPDFSKSDLKHHAIFSKLRFFLTVELVNLNIRPIEKDSTAIFVHRYLDELTKFVRKDVEALTFPRYKIEIQKLFIKTAQDCARDATNMGLPLIITMKLNQCISSAKILESLESPWILDNTERTEKVLNFLQTDFENMFRGGLENLFRREVI